jgi:hypothetical protein
MKGITKKQFWIQMILPFWFTFFGAWQLFNGIQDKDSLYWIFGCIMILASVTLAISLIVQRKRYLIEDPAKDAEVTSNFKTVLKGMGILYGIIILGFLVAFGLATLLS